MIELPKEAKFRSRAYLDWVKSLPSCISGRPADDPHHVIGHGRFGSVKHSDLWVIPLTRDEHDQLHRSYKDWERTYGSQLLYVLLTLERAFKDGVLTIGDTK